MANKVKGDLTVTRDLTVAGYLTVTGGINIPTDSLTANKISDFQTSVSANLDLIGKEDAFSKNTAFNKDFGNTLGTVTQGNDARLGTKDIDETNIADGKIQVYRALSGKLEYETVSGSAWSFTTGTGNPNGTISGNKGDHFYDNTNARIYIKATDGGNLGWLFTTMTFVDPVAPFLTTSLSAYESASPSSWVEVTNAEYDLIQQYAGVQTAGSGNAYLQTGTLSSFGGGLPYTFIKTEGNPNFPVSSFRLWGFKFYIGNVPMSGVNKVKMGYYSPSSGYLYDLGLLPNSSKINDFGCFVCKNGSGIGFSGTTWQLAATLSGSNANMYYNVTGNQGYYRDGDLTGSISSFNFSFNWGIQALAYQIY